MTRITIQDAVDRILAATAVEPLPVTADTFKTGDPMRELTGIVTTFLATAAVIARAAELGANLIIAHEPTFYTHEDATDWLEDDPVYQAKRQLIDEHGIVIWRFHDYWHLNRPDGIMMGLAQRLGWELDSGSMSAAEAQQALAMTAGAGWNTELAGRFCAVATIAPTPLAVLATQLKEQLGTAVVRVTGPDDLICRRVGLAIGALPGKMAIANLRRDDVDAIICGEVREWETCEYLRDAAFFGRPKGMLVVGHATNEEDGMAYLVGWLRPLVPGVTIAHVPCDDPLRVIYVGDQ